MQSIVEDATAAGPSSGSSQDDATPAMSPAEALQRKANRVRWLKLNFTVKAARLQTLKRQKYQHLQEEALLKARGLLHNWENNAVVLTEDLYRLAAGEREAEELMNYTPEALALRFSLRNDPKVLEAVRQLWQIEMPRDALGCIDQRGYAGVFRRIAKCLDAKAFKKKQKVDKLLDEDWKRDSKGEPTMSFANFFDSIFELADLWCETIDADDYVGFLNRLRDRISHMRRGKRSFKLMPKVLAFDADSDEEEEEDEEEDDADEDEDEEEPSKPAPPPPQPKILVTKAIKPPSQQPQHQAANVLRKVSRVAISSSKVLNRKDPPVTTTKPQTAGVTVAPVSVKEPVTPPVIPTPIQDTISPLVHQHSSQLSMGMPGRARRASVVTTIQFLDDGFVRSISDNMTNSAGGIQPPSVAAALPQSVVAAFAASTRRDQGLRPSLAAAANAALAERPTSAAVHQSNAETTPPQATQPPLTSQPSERKRVITVSTAKHAVLKSVVFATRKAPRLMQEGALFEELPRRDEIQQQQETVRDEVTGTRDENVISEPSRGGVPKTRGPTGGNPLGNAVAIRMRTGELFDVDDEMAAQRSTGAPTTTASKGLPLGFGKAGATPSRRGRGGLAPLSHAQPGIAPAFTGSVQNQRNTLTAIPHGPHSGPVALSGMTSNGGIDFSDSVVMTNYVVDRPSMTHSTQSLRVPTVLAGNAKKPALATLSTTPESDGARQSTGIQGTRALAKQTPTLEVGKPLLPSREPIKTRPMVVVVNKAPPPPQLQPTDAGHRYTGSNLGGIGHNAGRQLTPPVGATSLTPEGDPEHALRIKAALDREHGHVRGKDALAQSVVPHERHFDHTDPDSTPAQSDPARRVEHHGLVIESFPQGNAKPHHVRNVRTSPVRVVSPQSQYMDPTATPWDTSDDDDDAADAGSSASSARSLLQPENAMEALAKVISKRAASHSAGSTRDYRTVSAPSSASSVRRHSRTMDHGDPHGTVETDTINDDALSRRMPRGRLLTVSSLGGNSVENAQRNAPDRRFVRRGSDDEYGGDTDALLESASAPVLPTTSQLELDYSRQQLTSVGSPGLQEQRTRTTSQTDGSSSPLLKLPVRGRGRVLGPVDDLELRGELAMDPSLSPPRSPVRTAPRTSPIKICTCSRRRELETSDESDANGSHSWPPPVYRLDRATVTSANDPPDNDDEPDSPGICAACQRKRDLVSSDATIILNAKRELFLAPLSKEQDVLTLASRATPTRSEMMRRRHRYTHGKPT